LHCHALSCLCSHTRAHTNINTQLAHTHTHVVMPVLSHARTHKHKYTICTHTHTHTHTNTHVVMPVLSHTRTHKHKHTICTHTQTHTHTCCHACCSHMHMRRHTNINTHTYTQTCTHKPVHTRICTHRRTVRPHPHSNHGPNVVGPGVRLWFPITPIHPTLRAFTAPGVCMCVCVCARALVCFQACVRLFLSLRVRVFAYNSHVHRATHRGQMSTASICNLV